VCRIVRKLLFQSLACAAQLRVGLFLPADEKDLERYDIALHGDRTVANLEYRCTHWQRGHESLVYGHYDLGLADAEQAVGASDSHLGSRCSRLTDGVRDGAERSLYEGVARRNVWSVEKFPFDKNIHPAEPHARHPPAYHAHGSARESLGTRVEPVPRHVVNEIICILISSLRLLLIIIRCAKSSPSVVE
jgi:hypothetical protein